VTVGRTTMSPSDAARVLGVAPDAAWGTVRLAYRAQIRSHHPDHAGPGSSARAARIIEAFRVLDHARLHPPEVDTRAGPVRHPAPTVTPRRPASEGPAPPVHRIDDDTLLVDAPAEETFRWLLDAAHDIGEITYVDRSVPIVEVLCAFEGEPATSLLLTLQGRSTGTEVFATVESIEARPAPPSAAVIDLLELALHRRAHPPP